MDKKNMWYFVNLTRNYLSKEDILKPKETNCFFPTPYTNIICNAIPYLYFFFFFFAQVSKFSKPDIYIFFYSPKF